MKELDERYRSSLCEIKTMKNEIVATGLIADITDEYIDVTGRSGVSSTVGYGTEVKISVFNSEIGFRVLAGNIYLYSEDFVRITDVTTILDYERRHFFRVETKVPGQIFMKKPSPNEEPEEKMDVYIRDLSLGGCMVETKPELLKRGQRFYLSLSLVKGRKELFTCEVTRNIERDGYWQFGCTFLDYTDRQKDSLCAYVFKLQREQINKNR